MRRLLSHISLLFVVLAWLLPSYAAGAAKKASTAAQARARAIVRIALRERGIHYRYGGSSPLTGFDCSGFTRWVYSHVGIGLPHSSYAQFSLGRRISLGALRPGDLVFFNGVGHVGIYIGGGKYVHAPYTGTVVQVASLSRAMRSYDGARRVQ